MVTFRIDDMTCGRCAGVIGRAVTLVDSRALVEVEPVNGEDDAIETAIREAGYTPVRQ